MAASLAGGVVHPLGVESPAPEGEGQPTGGMNGLPRLSGTWCSVLLQGGQGVATTLALAQTMLVLRDAFPFLRATLWFLGGVTLVHLFWIAIVAIVDLYALMVKRSLHNTQVLLFLVMGDGLTGLLLLCATNTSAGVIIYIQNPDFDTCAGHPCARFQIAIMLSLFSSFLILPSFLLSLWALVSLWFAGILHPV